MQVVITLAGRGQRFSEKGFTQPKPIVSVAGKPALFYLLDSFDPKWSLNFVLSEHDRTSALEATIKEKAPSSQVIYTPYSERGPVDTVLAAIPFLQAQGSILVAYCDVAPVWNPADFTQQVSSFDMASVNYQGFHPTYWGPNSYCHIQTDPQTGLIQQFQEKVLFTNHIEKEITSAGLYYFKNKQLLQQALAEQLRQNLKHKNEFYVSLALQAALNQNPSLRILDYRIPQIVQFGTPADTERFEFWFKYLTDYKNTNKNKPQEFQYIEKTKTPLNLPTDLFEKEKNYWQKILHHFKMLT